jgi:hypothetical protein
MSEVGLRVLSIFALVLLEAHALPAKVDDSRKLCKFYRAISVKCQQSKRPDASVQSGLRLCAFYGSIDTQKAFESAKFYDARVEFAIALSRLPTFIRLAWSGSTSESGKVDSS